MNRFVTSSYIVNIILVAAIPSAIWTSRVAEGHDARPAYQVLDEKPQNLMLNYFAHDANKLANQHHVPPSRGQGDRRRSELQNQLRETLGKFPWKNRPPLNAHVTGKLDHGDHVVEKVLYESLPGLFVTALAYVPKNTHGRLPAVICVNG